MMQGLSKKLGVVCNYYTMIQLLQVIIFRRLYILYILQYFPLTSIHIGQGHEYTPCSFRSSHLRVIIVTANAHAQLLVAVGLQMDTATTNTLYTLI